MFKIDGILFTGSGGKKMSRRAVPSGTSSFKKTSFYEKDGGEAYISVEAAE